MSNQGHAPPCNLCGGIEIRVSDFLSGEDIRRMWEAYGEGLSTEQLAPVTPEISVRLFQCCNCGFRYFDPTLAGSAAFYEHLSRRAYYPAIKQEFAQAAHLARPAFSSTS
jgi:hypothetical protein